MSKVKIEWSIYDMARFSTDPDQLRSLYNTNDLDDKFNLALNEHTPPDILVELSTKSDILMREAVAENKGTPVNILIKLAERCSTMEHPADEYMMHCLLRNPSTPEPVKMWLKMGGFAGLTFDEFLNTMKGD